MTENKHKEQSDSPRRLIQSVKRASDILEIFLDERKPVGITEFSQRLSLPKTTIQGIVQTLVELKYLEKDQSTSKYRLGPMLFQLGMRYASNLDMIRISKIWMERLSYKLELPVNTGILVGNKVIIISRSEPDTGFTFFPQAGMVIPIHTTCIGKIIFAYMSEKRRNNILKNYRFESMTKNSITSAKEFDNELKRVCDMGISFDNEENIIGLAGIGGSVFNNNRLVIAAFAVTGDAPSINEKRKEIIKEVKKASEEVSELLGYMDNIK